ncbi:hypothetical protein D9M72_654000 [compost metagenome]
MRIVARHMVSDTGEARVHIGAAKILRRDHFAGRSTHQRWAGQENRALAFDDDGFIRHCRHIGAARRA